MDWVDRLIDGFGFSMLWLFIFAGTGVAFFLSLSVLRHKRRAIPVTVKVISLMEGTNSEGDTYWSPEFEVQNGPHAGVTSQSNMASSPPDHAVGDVMQASYDPRTGVIHSRSTLISARILTVGFLICAMVCLYLLRREFY